LGAATVFVTAFAAGLAAGFEAVLVATGFETGLEADLATGFALAGDFTAGAAFFTNLGVGFLAAAFAGADFLVTAFAAGLAIFFAEDFAMDATLLERWKTYLKQNTPNGNVAASGLIRLCTS
jgi:hypothetical protein